LGVERADVQRGGERGQRHGHQRRPRPRRPRGPS
jgi:hypothetical protein